MNITKISIYNQPSIKINPSSKQERLTLFAQNQNDEFVHGNKKQNKQISFTSLEPLSLLIRKYLKTKTYKNSIRCSKRPYLAIDKDLEDFIKEVTIKTTKNEEIHAFDINPNNADKYVLFLHGFSQNITNNQPLYKNLLTSDYGILAIDYRGYGKNAPTKHINEEYIYQDVEAATNYLKEKGITNIGLIGHSFGSYIAAKASNSNKFLFQILISPMISLEFWLKNVIKHPKKYKFETRLIKNIPTFKDQYAKIFNILKYIENNDTPTYVIQSRQDRYVRTSKVNELVKRIPNLQKYIILLSGGHRMDTEKITAIKRTLDYL